MTKGKSIRYTAEELSWIHANRTLPRTDLHKQFVARFDRNDVNMTNLKALCTRKGWKTGRTGQFHTGRTSWNKGKKMPSHPNSEKTQFKTGHKPHNTKYAGHERLSKEGYVEISIDETNPHTGFERRYVLKHRWLWQQKNGLIAEGHCLKCLDGNRQNCDPSNWEMIPLGVNARLVRGRHRNRTAYDDAPQELRPAILTIAKIEHEVAKGKSK